MDHHQGLCVSDLTPGLLGEGRGGIPPPGGLGMGTLTFYSFKVCYSVCVHGYNI